MAELPLLVFDVNETLLDLEALTPLFTRIFGAPGVMREWFAQVVLYSQALTLAETYAPFGEIGAAVLQMTAAVHGAELHAEDLEELKRTVARLPPHADTAAGLRRLKEAGFRLFTLTNNPAETQAAQLAAAGLSDLFERQFTVDASVRRYKPAKDTYGSVAEALGAPQTQLWLVACHAWDTLGARAAGWSAALILRPGNAPLAVGPQPNLVVAGMDELAERLIGGVRP